MNSIVATLLDVVDITLVHTHCVGVPPNALKRQSPRPLWDPREGVSLAIPNYEIWRQGSCHVTTTCGRCHGTAWRHCDLVACMAFAWSMDVSTTNEGYIVVTIVGDWWSWYLSSHCHLEWKPTCHLEWKPRDCIVSWGAFVFDLQCSYGNSVASIWTRTWVALVPDHEQCPKQELPWHQLPSMSRNIASK